MRKPFIAGNWKMHKNSAETAKLIGEIKKLTANVSGVDIAVAPPFTSLASAKTALGDSSIGLCAQNVHWEKEGAFTGELSPQMLLDAGCGWVIIGHSERRQYFCETDETVNKRFRAALSAGLGAIVCVGETLEEREADKTSGVIQRQLDGAFQNMENINLEKVIVAYEPVWAIGTGRTATGQQAQEVHALIRKNLALRLGANFGDSTRILYGGSVKPGNAVELLGLPDVDGALVGGASLIAEDFSAIIRASVEK